MAPLSQPDPFTSTPSLDGLDALSLYAEDLDS
jgi:hypothetical protein